MHAHFLELIFFVAKQICDLIHDKLQHVTHVFLGKEVPINEHSLKLEAACLLKEASDQLSLQAWVRELLTRKVHIVRRDSNRSSVKD